MPEDENARLTEAERELLLRAWPWPTEAATTKGGFGVVVAAVEQILSDRVSEAEAPTPCGAEGCPNCTSEYVDCPDGCQTCDNWYAEMVDRPPVGRYVLWREGDVDEHGDVRPIAVSDVTKAPGLSRQSPVPEVGLSGGRVDTYDGTIR